MGPPNARPLGKYERLYQERRERDRERWPARSQAECAPDGYWFDAAAAERIVEFCEQYARHHKGEWAGRPLLLEPWQKDAFREVFGWRRRDGTRRFRFAYFEIARKNGKSEVAAAVGLYLLAADGEAGAEVYSAATKRDQAKIVHDTATQMVKRSPALGRRIGVHRNNLHVTNTASKFEPLGADGDTLDGLNPHGVLVDELHAHRDRKVWDVLVTALGARRQPLVFTITTAGVYDPTAIGWEQHEYATKVLEGVFDDETFFAYVAAADAEDDWTEPATWWKANPNLGVSVKWEYLADLCEKAKRQPSFENTFKRLHLNLWTQQATRWISVESWAACEPETVEPVDEAVLLGRPAWGGLDLSSTTDFTALVWVFPRDDGSYALLPRFWIPEETLAERARSGRAPFDAWARDGWLMTTPGSVVDYAYVRAQVNEDAQRFDVRELAYDPWNAQQLANQLLEDDGLPLVEMRQGYVSMNAPSKEFERLVVARKLRHGNHPVLRWMVSNVTIRTDPAGNIKPDKERSVEKIDGVVATIMGLAGATLQRGAPKRQSVYETRGVRTY